MKDGMTGPSPKRKDPGVEVQLAVEDLLNQKDEGTVGVDVSRSTLPTPGGPGPALLCTITISRDALRGTSRSVHEVHKKAFELLKGYGTPSITISVIG